MRTGSVALVALAALIAGCGGSATGSPPPSPSSGAGPSAVGSAALPSPSPAASLTASATFATGGSPATDGIVVTIDDPDLAMRLPPGWRSLAPDAVRALIEGQSAGAPEEVRKVYSKLLGDVDAGMLRLMASGPSGLDPWQGTMLVEITNAGSVDEQIERNHELQFVAAQPKSLEQSPVTLSVGDGIRLDAIADPPKGSAGVPAHAIDYVIELADGRILWLNSTAPEASSTFAAMIEATIASLVAR